MTARVLKAQGKTVQQCIAAGLAAADFRQTLVRIWYRDTYGDGWDSGRISFKDTSTNTTIITLTGPASGPVTWFYTDVLFSNGTNYSVTKIGGAYPSDIKYAVTTTDTVAYLGTETAISTTDVNCILAEKTDALSYLFTIPSRYYYSVADLKLLFTLADLKAGGFTVTQLKIDFTLAQLIAEEFTLAQLIAEGFTASDLNAGGFTAADLKLAFTASELKAGGFTASELKAGGFTAAELSTIDFSVLGNLQNGSFEQPQMANDSYQYINSYQYISSDSTVPGWSLNAVLINNSSAWGYPRPYPAGNQAASIQSVYSQWISQRINLNAGSYDVTFYACGRPSGANTINVYCRQNSAGGTSEPPVLTFTPPTTAWQKYTATINIPSFGNYALGFYGTRTDGDYSSAIQNVKITPTSSALPPIYTLLELKAAYTASELKAVYTLLELKDAYTLLELKAAYTASELKDGGFLLEDLQGVGFTDDVLKPLFPLAYVTFSGSGVLTMATVRTTPEPSIINTVIITDYDAIGYGAFSNLPNLTTVSIPSSVKTIGDYAFQNCSNLTSVVIPADSQLVSIGNFAFQGCPANTSVKIPPLS